MVGDQADGDVILFVFFIILMSQLSDSLPEGADYGAPVIF